MIGLGLSAVEQRAFHAALLSDHAMDVRVSLLDLDHNLVGQVRGGVLSGQVDVDTSQAVDRSAQVEIVDRDNALGLDSAGIGSAALHADRMLRIEVGVWAASLPEWVWVPVFTGPITGAKRSGVTSSLTAHGKESLLLGPCSANLVWRKGARITDIIGGLLEFGGEAFREIPRLTQKSTRDTVLAPPDVLWDRAQGWVRALGTMRLWFDGRGTAVLRPAQGNPVWTFRTGEHGDILDRPQHESDTTKMRNFVVVSGATPKGASRPVQGVAYAPASHPFSSTSLARAGRKRHIREDISDDSVTTVAAANALAQAKLSELLQAGVQTQMSTMVIPHLEPWDVVRVADAGASWSMQLQKYSIPLTHDGQMTIGHFRVTRTLTRRAR